MAPRFHSTTFVVLAVLVTVCSLRTDHANAACPPGFRNCGYNHRNRCSTSIKTDPKNCGNCGVTCRARPNSTPTCSNGRCTVHCKPNYANCDTKARNGCEVATSSNPNHCGKCRRKCPAHPNTVPSCTNGRCTPKCQPGWADCNNNMRADGCETSVSGFDRRNCGQCGSLCAEDRYPFAVSTCSAGTCGLLLCYRGMEDCNGVVADGCEQNTFTNPMACGRCGNVCPTFANAVPVCASGICRSVCEEGFDYCYGSEIDDRGCQKIFFDVDANNCGGAALCALLGRAVNEEYASKYEGKSHRFGSTDFIFSGQL